MPWVPQFGPHHPTIRYLPNHKYCPCSPFYSNRIQNGQEAQSLVDERICKAYALHPPLASPHILHQHMCYILILPLLFLTLIHSFTHLPMKLLILRTALPLSLTFLIPFPLTPLISSLMLPLKPSLSLHCYALGHTPLTTLVSSTPIVLMKTLWSFGLQLGPIRLMFIPLNTLPSVTSISALLTTLMVVTNELSSYLLILSHLSSLLISY